MDKSLWTVRERLTKEPMYRLIWLDEGNGDRQWTLYAHGGNEGLPPDTIIDNRAGAALDALYAHAMKQINELTVTNRRLEQSARLVVASGKAQSLAQRLLAWLSRE